jgi:hypothetical protein
MAIHNVNMPIPIRKWTTTVWFYLFIASFYCCSTAVVAFCPSRRPIAFAVRSNVLAPPSSSLKAGLVDTVKSFIGGNKEKDASAVAVLEKNDDKDDSSTDDKEITSKEAEEEDDKKEDKNAAGFQLIKQAGKAGAISLFLWEGAFWVLSVPVVTFGYVQATGHMPDFTDKEDLGKLGAEAFAFANVARFALPLRIALAVGTIPWCQENVVDRFWPADGETAEEEQVL